MNHYNEPTFIATASSIETEPCCYPIHISTPIESNHKHQKLIAETRREQSRSRRAGSERKYRQRWSPDEFAALRISNRASPKPQERNQKRHDSFTPLRSGSPAAYLIERPSSSPSRQKCVDFSPRPFDASTGLTDEQASSLVEQCFRQRRETRWGRTLRKRLNHELDLGLNSIIKSLDAILVAADTVFFNGKLRNRVEWRWSCETDRGFINEFVGTTTPKYSMSEEFGIQAEIVLSKPLLQSGQYSSNLLLSTFLHELVHCYLFICCGARAQENGGHTPGFQRIVSLIQSWLGNPRLRLCSMRADLDNFLSDAEDQQLEQAAQELEQSCLLQMKSMSLETVYHHGDEEPVYSDFSNSPVWAGDREVYLGELEEEVQSELTGSLLNSPPLFWNENAQPQPSWEETSWADTPSMGYVSRQELDGAIEGSPSMPIVVD